jgi:diguanylate cyclase (GGDEF)-like protein
VTAGAIALAAALAALVVVVLGGVVGRRARAESEERIAAALRDVGLRMDTLAEELSTALELAREDGMRVRALGDLGGTLDLDEALARTVEAATCVRGIDAAVVRATGLDGTPLVAASGVPQDEAERQVVSGPPDGHHAHAVSLAYVYPAGAEPPGVLRSGIAVPLEADGEPLGFLAAYSHDPGSRLAADTLARLQAIAAAAGPAIDTARRFREARGAIDADAVTGLPGRRSFHDALAREVARAHRYERRLALLVLDVDDFHDVNDRVGLLGGDEVLAETAALVRGAVRETDVAYRAGGDEFAVLLPESTRIDAEGMFARVLATVRRRQAGISLSGGIAELQADDDALTFFERAEQALHRAKTIGKGTAA